MVETSGISVSVRSHWRVVAALGAIVLFALGCLSWHHLRQPGTGAGSADVLIVGDQRGGVQSLLQAAGELDHVPYRIEWAKFPAAAPLLEALNADAVDIGGIGGQPFAFAYASGAKIKVVYAARQIDSPLRGKASAIVVPGDSPLRRVEDLKGHKLATVRGSSGQDFALRLFERHGLKPDDVTWVYLNNAEAKGALASGAIDAWSTWGSYVGYALLRDHQRTLGDGRELAPETGFFAASDKAIATKHALIADFVKRLAKARAWAGAHRQDYAAVLAQDTGLPLDVARFTVEAYITAPVKVDDGLAQEQRAIFNRYKAAGLIDKVPDLTGAFDGSFSP